MPHEGTPAIHGRWRSADPTLDPATAPSPTKTPGDSFTPGDNLGVYAVHMAMLRTGRVLMFSGGWESSELLHRSWSWDPSEPIGDALGRWFMPEFDEPIPPHGGPPTTSDDPDIDLFCCHHVFLPDGRLLAVGGDGAGTHDNASLHVYDPIAERWEKIAGRAAPALPDVTYPPGMVAGRWYPTSVVMPDGSVAVFSGDSPGPIVVDAEILRPPDYLPTVITGGRRVIDGTERALFMYPGMHLVRGGRVFYVPTSFRYSGTEAAVLAQTGPTASFRMTGETTGVWENYYDPADPAQPIVPANRFREEGTSVLLSPAQAGRILLIGGGWWSSDNTQHGDHRSCEILDTQAPTPTWSPAGQMHHPRINVNAVLLPDGKVLILGGHDEYKWNPHTWDTTEEKHPQEQAEIYDPTAPYDPANPSAAFTPVAEMHAPRMYHSGALLLPDGRVLVAAGSDNHETQHGRPVDEKHMEIYEPPYCHQGQRPVIDGVGDTGGPDDQIHYGGQFTIQYQVEAGATIASVALMRPGACTHHTDTEQRHIPLNFTPSGANTLSVEVINDASVAPPGYYMLFIVDSSGRPCERALFLRLSQERCDLVADRSHFSIDEVESLAVGGVSELTPCFYLIVHGFRPSQLGITTTTPDAAQLAAFAPPVTFSETGGGPVANLAAFPSRMLLEVPGSSLDVQQRVTFEYGIRFTGTGMFPAAGAMPESRDVRMSVAVQGRACTTDVTLFRQPNPFMLDGPTSWLSTDLRVFALRPGESQSGRSLDTVSPDPLAYLSGFVSACDTTPASSSHPFDQITTNQQDSRLYLSELREGQPVYNFAIARVRYTSAATPATNVRVFFRLFTTAVTSMAYAADTYPRNAAGTLPTLGQSATDILTIPCFGVSRDTVEASGDTINTKTVPASGATETHRYFGVWLDFNQTTPRYTDPDDGVLKSIQDLIRGKHQCLVAEIRFGPDTIPPGDTPANNDNLAQRNLAIVESDNPGDPDSHVIQHTFDLRTTWPHKRQQPIKRAELQPDTHAPQQPVHTHAAPVEHTHEDTHEHTHEHEHAHVGEAAHVPANVQGATLARTRGHAHTSGPDELMIQWGGLPEDSDVTLYLPALDADEIVSASTRYGRQHLERVDAHTIRCRVSDVSYIPLPASAPTRVAGLITIRLPDTVRKGQRFRVVVRQIGGLPRRVVGTFELFVVVSTAEAVRPEEERLLSVLRHIGRSIRPTSRWHAIFERYLEGTSDKVRGLGGTPGQIAPSPKGEPEPPREDGADDAKRRRRCTWLSWLVLALTALLIVVLAHVELAAGRWAFVFVVLALIIALVSWLRLCNVSTCRALTAVGVGASLGVALVAVLWLLGALGAGAMTVLAFGAVAAGLLLVLALACARDTGWTSDPS